MNSIQVETHLTSEGAPLLLLKADSEASNGDMDILLSFIKQLNDQNFIFHIQTFVDEELVVKTHELPEKYWETKIVDLPNVFKKKMINLVVKLIDKRELPAAPAAPAQE